jgi:2-dehydro-3-deoxyphosphogalactonate aldolase
VGGVAVDAVADFAAAGADGLGLGSALYRPGLTAGEVGERAARFAAAWRAATAARRESGG